MLSFTLDGVEYNFEEGMTWRQWLESDYNKDGYILDIKESQPIYFICKPGDEGSRNFIALENGWDAYFNSCDEAIIADKSYIATSIQ